MEKRLGRLFILILVFAILINISDKYVFNQRSKVYHTFTCKCLAKMSDTNKMYARGIRTVLKRGGKPCKICMPPSGNYFLVSLLKVQLEEKDKYYSPLNKGWQTK